MNQMSGEKPLRHLFQTVKWAGFDVKNHVKYGACCVSNYNSRDGFITERELALTKVIATGMGTQSIRASLRTQH